MNHFGKGWETQIHIFVVFNVFHTNLSLVESMKTNHDAINQRLAISVINQSSRPIKILLWLSECEPCVLLIWQFNDIRMNINNDMKE